MLVARWVFHHPQRRARLPSSFLSCFSKKSHLTPPSVRTSAKQLAKWAFPGRAAKPLTTPPSWKENSQCWHPEQCQVDASWAGAGLLLAWSSFPFNRSHSAKVLTMSSFAQGRDHPQWKSQDPGLSSVTWWTMPWALPCTLSLLGTRRVL